MDKLLFQITIFHEQALKLFHDRYRKLVLELKFIK